jgi:threonine/homoserine/homoserine lactone efflux protein
MNASEWVALMALGAAMSFSPGPNTTLSTALAANFGLRRALSFCLAVPTGWVLLLLACGLGVGALVTSMPALRWTIKLTGVAYLLWLVWKLNQTTTLAQADPRRLQVTFVQGVALQFVNIKAWMIALTLTAGWVVNANGQPATNTGERLTLVAGCMVFYAFTSNFTYALVGSMLRGWLAQGRRLLWFNRVLGMVLVVTAAWMLTV